MDAISQMIKAWEWSFSVPRVSIELDFENQAWGWCGEFRDLGFVALILGPLHIQFDWDIN